MNKFLKAFCLIAIFTVGAFAQSGDDYNKNEYFVGYSNQQVDSGNHQTFNGFEAAYVRNFSRYFGVKGDVSGAYRNRNVNFSGTTTGGSVFNFTGNINRSLYNFLGGVQVKDNEATTRFRPFAHALAGVAVVRNRQNLTCTGTCISNANLTFTDTRFAAAFGGGLDIKINRKIDFRAIQVDYNPIFYGSNIGNNVRFGIGIVFK